MLHVPSRFHFGSAARAAVWLAWFCGALAIAPFAQAQGGGAEPAVKRVALIFDDGPSPAQAAKLHALLAEEKLRVTFAFVGRNVERFPDVARAAQAAGHEIVNHSYTHAKIAELSAEGVDEQVARGQSAIQAVLGAPPRWYWPPFLAVDERLTESLRRHNIPRYVPALLVDSRDWDRSTTAEAIRRNATQGVRDGAVILFHEWRDETIAQLPQILAELRKQGCAFLTLSELHDALNKPDGAEKAVR